MMDFDEGIDLSFDVYFAVDELTLDASLDDDFNIDNTFFTDLLYTVGDLYGENSKARDVYVASYTKPTGRSWALARSVRKSWHRAN
jgi:hypothetical protein